MLRYKDPKTKVFNLNPPWLLTVMSSICQFFFGLILFEICNLVGQAVLLQNAGESWRKYDESSFFPKIPFC